MDPGRFRHVLGHFPTGVVVVTAMHEESGPVGMAVGSFTSVSLDPPLVAFFPDRSSTSFPKIRDAGSFCINVLAEDQEHVCRAFAARGGDKYGSAAWQPGRERRAGPRRRRRVDRLRHRAGPRGRRPLHRAGPRPRPRRAATRRRRCCSSAAATVASRPRPARRPPSRICCPSSGCSTRHAARWNGWPPTCRLECLAVTVVRDEIVTIGSAGQAYGLGPTDRIGQRMPFVPPLCSVFVAWAGADAVENWLANLDPQMPARTRGSYREMVATVRRRGWSIALAGRPHIAFELALAQLSVARPDRGAAAGRAGGGGRPRPRQPRDRRAASGRSTTGCATSAHPSSTSPATSCSC